jgi:hypothetical protein
LDPDTILQPKVIERIQKELRRNEQEEGMIEGKMVHLVRNGNEDEESGNRAQINIPSPGYPTKLPKERGNRIAAEIANEDSRSQLEQSQENSEKNKYSTKWNMWDWNT